MFELFIPYVFASIMGITMEAGDMGGDMAASVADTATSSTAASDLETAFGDSEDSGAFGDDEAVGEAKTTATRAPETELPSGKYTTAVEVKPILGMTKTSWVAVRLYEGNDLLYFTHLMAWRCGLWEIRYGINGAPADTVFAMEPCNTDYAQPNAMIDMDNFPVYVTLPPNSVESVYVEILFDDGTTEFMRANRGDILIP